MSLLFTVPRSGPNQPIASAGPRMISHVSGSREPFSSTSRSSHPVFDLMESLGDELDLSQYPITYNSHAFNCSFPGCNASYRRKEHLHRHERKHFQQQEFLCSKCGRQFGRSDTLRRHVRQRHGIIEPLKRAQRACKSCHAGKSRCEGGVPCDECLRRKIECSFSDPAGTAENQSPGSETHRASSMKHDQPQLQNTENAEHYIRLYFEAFHPSWPFIHKGSFDIRRETPFLVQSMIVIGLWATREPPAQSAAVELHDPIGRKNGMPQKHLELAVRVSGQ
ncbi:hypothetical protein PENPOL_c011G10631 [Penicillium polonicum]|uniref:C2H2-type domain-containing protein n=1 Tax=Penicillium polonicum TaxID=60169 RepID=A0A1V6NE41_PENPO|nr:hypothetical protein PENPOL_c011G10631 [Penicillium polonicum]